MPRSRYQFTEEDVPVVHRWVHAKLRDIAWPQHEAACTAWEQFPRAQPTATQLQQWCVQYLDTTHWAALDACTRTPPRHTGRVDVNDSDNIAGASALLDSLLSSGL